MYTLGLISEQGLFNEGLRVNATQKGEISEVVRNVMKTYLNTELDDDSIEESRTHVKIIPTKKSPFSLIRSLQTKAVPAKTYNTSNSNVYGGSIKCLKPTDDGLSDDSET